MKSELCENCGKEQIEHIMLIHCDHTSNKEFKPKESLCEDCGLPEKIHPIKDFINMNTKKRWSCKQFKQPNQVGLREGCKPNSMGKSIDIPKGCKPKLTVKGFSKAIDKAGLRGFQFNEKGCGKEGHDGETDEIIICGKGILCDECSKEKL